MTYLRVIVYDRDWLVGEKGGPPLGFGPANVAPDIRPRRQDQ